MNGEDLRFLANRAEGVRGRADNRLAEVRSRIRTARRRRAAEVVAGTSAALLALVVGVALLTGPTGQRKGDGPIPPVSSETPAKATRKIVYSDDLVPVPHKAPTPLSRVGTIHVGEREVEIGQVLHTVQGWALRVTDAGAVYAKDDRSVWLTDGDEPRRIADQACVDTTQYSGLATGNVGPWAVWFDCSPASQGADLVVFDTVSGNEVARLSIPSCRVREPAWPGEKCRPRDVVGKHVHFDRRGQDFVVDVASGQVAPARPKVLAEDIESHPRGLVVGDDWQTGYRVTGIEQPFRVVGSRLVPELDVDSEQILAKAAFDTATRRAVRLRLPSGYHVTNPSEIPAYFILVEWLDDGTVALAQGNTRTHFGDILVCHLSDGRCEVAVEAPAGDATRIVAGGPLPG